MTAEASATRPQVVPGTGSERGHPGVVPDDDTRPVAADAPTAPDDPDERKPVPEVITEVAPEVQPTETEPPGRPYEPITEIAPETDPAELQPPERPYDPVVTEIAPETAPTETEPERPYDPVVTEIAPETDPSELQPPEPGYDPVITEIAPETAPTERPVEPITELAPETAPEEHEGSEVVSEVSPDTGGGERR
jgi:hypothetical protein